MKGLLSIVFVLFLLPMAFAVDLDINKLSKEEVLIIGLDSPANIELEVTNNGRNDAFSFYTFFGSGITPSEPIEFSADESKNISLQLHPRLDSSSRGNTKITYFVQGQDRSEIEQQMVIRLIDLRDAFEIGSVSFYPETSSIEIFVRNKVNFDFENLKIDFSSPFFELSEEINLDAYESKEFQINLNREDYNKLTAGFYTMNADLEIQDIGARIQGKIEFIEKDLLNTEYENYGFIVSTKIISRSNDGNTMSEATTTAKKNIASRLFTTFSPEPDVVNRDGLNIYYTWEDVLLPGDSQIIKIKTNWFIPFFIIFLAVGIVYFAKKYSNQKIVLKKRVTFVKAKGGEFALKVTITAEAREFVENVRIIERLPPLVSMYEKFAGEFPDKISRDKKRLEWDFNYLDVGEKRVMTYIVYSKVGILGKFALPGTICRFEKEGKSRESYSNKAYFLSEQRDRRR